MIRLSNAQAAQMLGQKARNKYHNTKTELDGFTFDSKREAERYAELKLMERVGHIRDLMLQPSFELIPRQVDSKGRVIERAARYVADFAYYDKVGNLIVEDVKSVATMTEVYRLKKKLMRYLKGIEVREV